MEQSTAIDSLPFRKQQAAQQAAQLAAQDTQIPMAAGEGPPMPINTAPDAAARFAQMPMAGEVVRPVPSAPKPMGPGQGMSAPLKPVAGVNREFFGLASVDYKSTLVVFALILIFSSTIFYDFVRRYIPLVSGEGGRTTLLGSLLGAILGSVIYLVVKIVAKI